MPGSIENATFSNSGTICPLANSPRSPPFSFDGQADSFLASSANFAASSLAGTLSSWALSALIFVSASAAAFAATAAFDVIVEICLATSVGSSVILSSTSFLRRRWITMMSRSACSAFSLPNG